MNIQKLANIEARNRNYGSATSIKFSPDLLTPHIKHIAFGYRKYTTGQYVPHAYLAKFGWKNTYYQHAETTITFPLWVGWLAGEDL